MSTPTTKLCVFCGSSSGSDPSFVNQAKKLGNALADKQWGLVYGGGSTGLMGAVANGCASKRGYVHGIIPEALISRERTEVKPEEHNIDNHNGLTPIPDSKEYGHTTLVKDMHTRKRLMGQEADAFVALPGGYGTLEELMEVVTWQQLSIHDKPIVIFNINGFFDSFLKFIQASIDSQFVSVKNGEIIKVANTVEEVIKAVEEYKLPEGRFNLKWDHNTGDNEFYDKI
ncbi:uncharacterized protein SPAPADRAFT_61945 [Spathaspora passalidarum NRRL Y-27907]|uniref:Lysine decarboxylase-like protein n=1 Tax=Spathaspora passalidarum (strain NRRL Y-27907 / 11-Y1) TaxID=619300 RepID=G3ARV9_SPAPN|nr:uncharacterized protein SPAPADRAFT_61945 [Spathaspora passalidarum NRRL Y-27907]EGW31375.1 hypothetical protein SPAPADRAFT_61945 [Spathaspora passalidarum NRRL Y-27907]